EACRSLIETVVSFDWRFCASLLGVTFPIPPSTLLSSLVTLTLGPTTAWLPSTLGENTSAQAKSADTRASKRRFLITPSLSLSLGPWGPTKPRTASPAAVAVRVQRNSPHSSNTRARCVTVPSRAPPDPPLSRRPPRVSLDLDASPAPARRPPATKASGSVVDLYPFWGIPAQLHFPRRSFTFSRKRFTVHGLLRLSVIRRH